MPHIEVPFAPDLKPEELHEELAGLHASNKKSLNYWPDDWTSPHDPLGFLQWYQQYSAGRRGADDEKQKRRWWLFRQRHGALFAKNPSPRRGLALRSWAIDPVQLLPEAKRDEFKKRLDAFLETRRAQEKAANFEAPQATVTFTPVTKKPALLRPPAPPHVAAPRGAPPVATAAGARKSTADAYAQFLWQQENAARKGFSQATSTWKTYDDRGHPAVGPGIRVPRAGSYSDAQVQSMLRAQIDSHAAKARAAVEAAHGAGAWDKLPESYRWGLTDFYYNGVPAPRLAAAMVKNDAEGIRRESTRYTTGAGGEKIPLTRRNAAWWSSFIEPVMQKQGSSRLGAGVLFRNEDDTVLLQLNTDGPAKGKLRPAGGGKDDGDETLRHTIIRELGEEFGLEPAFCDERLRLLGFIKDGEYKDCALFEMTDHGLSPAKFQASNDPDEKVTLVMSDLDHPLYVGPQPGDLREPETPAEIQAEWMLQMGPKAPESEKQAAAMPSSKLRDMLAAIDLDALEAQARADLASGKATRRGPAIKRLAAINGLRRNNLRPEDLMVRSVPIVPPAFRPFSVAGDTFIPGDANELYRDLFEHRRILQETREALGDQAAGDARLALYDAQRALYGYGEPTNHKLRARSVSGFLKKITGPGSPKFSFPLRKLIGKPQDNVGRAVIVVDPTLGLDEVGIPKSQAWVAYAPHVQRRLVRNGMAPGDALKHIEQRSDLATRALLQEAAERPVVYSRAPAWHKFSVLSGRPQLIDGDAIAINPFVGTGLNADHDGDTMNFHVPATSDAVEEAHEKLMPSKMLFTIRDPDKVMPQPKHEAIMGLFAAKERPALKKWRVKDEATALKAIEQGKIDPDDEIEFGS